MELPEFVSAKTPWSPLRDQVIEKVHPNTRPVDQIFCELAEACGVGEYFQFTVEELADAQLRTVGLSLEALRTAGGTVAFPEKAYVYGKTPSWKTPTGKIQFASDACEKAGAAPHGSVEGACGRGSRERGHVPPDRRQGVHADAYPDRQHRAL